MLGGNRAVGYRTVNERLLLEASLEGPPVTGHR